MAEEYQGWEKDEEGVLEEPVIKQEGGVPAATAEIGTPGLRESGGFVDEEFARALRGGRAMHVFREMADNDSVIGAILNTIDKMTRQVDWRVEPADEDDPQAVADAEFVQECMDDMSSSWADAVSDWLSYLTFGWSYNEIVYKRRLGENQRDGSRRSKFNDGMFGWRKISGRAQETLERWQFDEQGGIQGMWQQDPYKGPVVFIPIERAVLLRTQVHKNNPEGKSIFRNAWRAWKVKKVLENILAVGIERDLTGIPMAEVPARWLSANATPEERQAATNMKKIVQTIKRDEHEGLVFPKETDEDGNDVFKFSLVTTGGRRQVDLVEVIRYLDSRIAGTSLADFILMGHDKVGSFSLGDSKTNLFSFALGSYLDIPEQALNRHAIPRLFRLNGWARDAYPKIRHGDIEQVDLNELANFISASVGTGTIVPDLNLEEYIRDQAGLPKRGDEDVD